MILSLIVAFVLLLTLWPYFAYLNVIVFQKNTSSIEPKMKGRPNRRTVGRRNDDVTKAILAIFSGYILICIGFYVIPDYERILQGEMDVILKMIAIALGVFLISPVCRSANAYIELCHIAVIHVVVSISAAIAISGFFYGFSISINQIGAVGLIALGAMLTFSRHNDFIDKGKAT